MSLIDEMQGSADGISLIQQLQESAEIDAAAWIPEEKGDHCAGTLVETYEIQSDHKDAATGTFPMCPVWVIEDSAGELWRVIGYRGVLRGEMNKAEPSKGDEVAVLYLGIPEGKDYHLYKAASRPKVRGSVATEAAPAASRSNQHEDPPPAKKPATPRKKPAPAVTSSKPADDEPPY